MTALETTDRPSVVAKALGVTPAVVTGIVNRLEDQGLVRRALRRGDIQAWVLEVTQEGIAARTQLVDRQLATFSAALASLSGEEMKTVVDTLAMFGQLATLDA